MTERINTVLNSISYVAILALAVLTPFLFWNLTTEFYETPKFLIVSALILILLLVWGIRFIIDGKATTTNTSLDLPFIILLGVLIVSTVFAASRPVAIFGNLPRIHGSLISFVLYIIAYFVLVSNLKRVNVTRAIIPITLVSGIILSAISLTSFFGINVLSLPWTAGLNFTPTGSTFSTTAILAIFTAFPLMLILQDRAHEILGLGKSTISKLLLNALLAATLTLFAVTIILTGSFAAYVALAAVYILALFATPQTSIKKNMAFITIPVIIAVAAAFLSFAPIGGANNIFHAQSQKFPHEHEIQLPFDISWKVSVSAFRDAPIWGTGPASYLFNFTTYKPVEFNASKFWNVRFDQAFNEYLQVLATLGVIGLAALLLLTVAFVAAAFKALANHHDSLNAPLGIAGITFFILLALHPSTMPLWIIGILILALFMAGKNTPDQIAAERVNRRTQLHLETLPVITMVIIMGFISYSGYIIGKTALADYYHRQALNAIIENQRIPAFNGLIKAERLNPEADSYRRDIALVNFDIANTIAIVKGPSEASPSGSLTDADKQQIQLYLSQAITEGRAAVTLSPNNAANWEMLGSIYRQISGVAQNALAFSLDAYGKAIQKDPVNPTLRLTVGGIYYSVKNYDLAIRFFTDAINLKPDYANAYYNLAIAFRDKGDLASAIASAEKTVSLTDPKSDDYKIAADLLAALKSKTAAEEVKPDPKSELTPASKTSSALEDKKMPKVLNLPKPEKVSTPAAVKKEVKETPEENQ